MYFVYIYEVMKMRYTLSYDLTHGIEMDPSLCLVHLFGHAYRLTQQEYLLFDQLLQSAKCACGQGTPVRALSRGELLRGAWGSAADYETRTVDVHVQRLRAKLGPDVITTVYRKGYCINPMALRRFALR